MIEIAVTVSGVRTDFRQMLKYGEIVRFQYFSTSGANANYDDETVLTVSGTAITASGLTQPLDDTRGSADAILLQEGRLLRDDIKMYVDNTVNTSGMWNVTRFLTATGGSPQAASLTYAPIDNGVIPWRVNGSVVYKKTYLRVLTNGSFMTE